MKLLLPESIPWGENQGRDRLKTGYCNTAANPNPATSLGIVELPFA
jgi:hypothetical protein